TTLPAVTESGIVVDHHDGVLGGRSLLGAFHPGRFAGYSDRTLRSGRNRWHRGDATFHSHHTTAAAQGAGICAGCRYGGQFSTLCASPDLDQRWATTVNQYAHVRGVSPWLHLRRFRHLFGDDHVAAWRDAGHRRYRVLAAAHE